MSKTFVNGKGWDDYFRIDFEANASAGTYSGDNAKAVFGTGDDVKLYWDASDFKVDITGGQMLVDANSSSDEGLKVTNTGSGVPVVTIGNSTIKDTGTNLQIEGNTQLQLSPTTGATSKTITYFSDSSSAQSKEALRTETLTQSGNVFATGTVTVNEEAQDVDFRVESLNESKMFTVDASADRVEIEASHNNTIFNIISTDATAGSGPDVVLHRDSASPASADLIGVVVFAGDNSVGSFYEYARLQGGIDDATDGSEDGTIGFRLSKGGSFNVKVLECTSNEVVINEDSKDIDFRVESDLSSNLATFDAGLFGGKGAIGFGHTGDDAAFVRVSPEAYTATASTSTAHLQVQATGITVPSGTTPIIASLRVKEPIITNNGTINNAATVYVQDAPTEGTANFALWVAAGATQFDGTLSVTGVTTLAGDVIFNEDAGAFTFRVEGSNNADLLDVNGNNFSGIGSIGMGGDAVNTASVSVTFPAFTAGSGTNISGLRVAPVGITVPTGTTTLATSLTVEEPILTATGTITNAVSLYIKNAPTEGGTNYALWVDDGSVKIDADLTTGSIAGTGTVALTDNMTITDAKNIVLDTTTGTKIGTATSQKLGFFNATPVVQRTAPTTLNEVITVLSDLGLTA